ncbi:hypothetical protein [Sutcliffiella deserti]|uniref:hypothetical protein n=1 Tax=Sutcliffiella deserti TaxID=2875501 RepID=UPI001CBB4DD7|nr:hypothetical protein [Sutcliffiella deserti]
MVSVQLRIFIEYPIKNAVIQKYEDTMSSVHDMMKRMGAENIQWTKSSNQHGITFYRESFILPTESHYFAMKELRCTPRNIVFHELSQLIDMEAGSIQFLGLKITS